MQSTGEILQELVWKAEKATELLGRTFEINGCDYQASILGAQAIIYTIIEELGDIAHATCCAEEEEAEAEQDIAVEIAAFEAHSEKSE